MGFGVWGLGFGVWGLGLRVCFLGSGIFRIKLALVFVFRQVGAQVREIHLVQPWLRRLTDRSVELWGSLGRTTGRKPYTLPKIGLGRFLDAFYPKP